MGYLRDLEVEGGCKMLLRREPKGTIWPGGVETVKCRCSSVPGRGQCGSCVCRKNCSQCSELCRCKRACLEEGPTDGNTLHDKAAGDSTDEEEDDIESDDERDGLPGVGSESRVGTGGFCEDDILEYASLEEVGGSGCRGSLLAGPYTNEVGLRCAKKGLTGGG